MSKIQSAKEHMVLINKLLLNYAFEGSPAKAFRLATDAQRSRDRAIVERTKEKIREAEGPFVGDSGRLFTRAGIFSILDSVLRELEGEEESHG